MNGRKGLAVGLAGFAIAAGLSAGAIAVAGGGTPGRSAHPPKVSLSVSEASSDGEGTEHGSDAERAKAAALEATGGGHANAVERDSENGATWEVEVTRKDGSTVDVRLDENYNVVVIESDSEAPADGGS